MLTESIVHCDTTCDSCKKFVAEGSTVVYDGNEYNRYEHMECIDCAGYFVRTIEEIS